MTGKLSADLCPSACFVVERVPSKGYQVTSAEGRYAKEWNGRALALLDTLGQPDPKGPAEYYRWVGPIAPSGEYVGVSVKLTPNGEAWYHQAWFQATKPLGLRILALRVLVMLVIFAAGAFAGRSLLAPDVSSTLCSISGNGLSESCKVDLPPKDPPPDVRLTMLKNEIASSWNVRDKLKGYLSQNGFAASLKAPVTTVETVVRLQDFFTDRITPGTIENKELRLTNVEVRHILNLLAALDEWTTKPMLPQKAEGR